MKMGKIVQNDTQLWRLRRRLRFTSNQVLQFGRKRNRQSSNRIRFADSKLLHSRPERDPTNGSFPLRKIWTSSFLSTGCSVGTSFANEARYQTATGWYQSEGCYPVQATLNWITCPFLLERYVRIDCVLWGEKNRT